MVRIIPADNMRIIFIFLDFLTFTLLWILYDDCGEQSDPLKLYNCVNGKEITSNIYKPCVQEVGSRVTRVYEFVNSSI